MYRELILFGSIVVVALFMTIHNRNQQDINSNNQQALEHRNNRDNILMKEGSLIKLSNGIILKKSADLIFISQSNSTIILNKADIDEVVAFLEE